MKKLQPSEQLSNQIAELLERGVRSGENLLSQLIHLPQIMHSPTNYTNEH